MRRSLLIAVGISASGILLNAVMAGEFTTDYCPQPACGKVCKLVCETKKLTAICYACECNEICIPGCSRRGGKHCATQRGEITCNACESGCSDCRDHTPEAEFCWYDWFASGCAQPRTVKLLTKYQAEKEIDWYHWEVVDAACCGCVAETASASTDRSIYKPAPADAELGQIIAVTDEEWSELASVLRPDAVEVSPQLAGQSSAPGTANDWRATADEAERVSIAERLGRLLKR